MENDFRLSPLMITKTKLSFLAFLSPAYSAPVSSPANLDICSLQPFGTFGSVKDFGALLFDYDESNHVRVVDAEVFVDSSSGEGVREGTILPEVT